MKEKKIIPLSKFAEVLRTYRDQSFVDWEEVIMAADLLGSRPNYFTMDEMGNYHAQASGTMDEVIRALTHHLEKINKIKQQQQGTS